LIHDGEQGLAAILSNKPDLVICDVRMPRMSGFELLEWVVATGPPVTDIPFVFLTALDEQDSRLAGRRLGADDYLTRPVDFEMLGVVIEHRLQRLDRSSRSSEFHLTDREREVLT
jgi:DNA-binding NarL/FixJ family response regulator